MNKERIEKLINGLKDEVNDLPEDQVALADSMRHQIAELEDYRKRYGG